MSRTSLVFVGMSLHSLVTIPIILFGTISVGWELGAALIFAACAYYLKDEKDCA